MSDFRSYHGQRPSSLGERIQLSPEESNHLVAANRARQGDTVSLFDGRGCECVARLVEADKRRATLEVSKISLAPKPAHRIALAPALPKGKLLETIIRKASEIGAQQVFPIASKRCEAKVDFKKKDSKGSKWAAAALEGAKQSGNPYLVEVQPICEFARFMELGQGFDLKLVASLQPGAPALKSHLSDFRSRHADTPPQSAVCLIGPEGDFTPEEYRQAAAHGFLPLSLGPHVMRSETAAIHALSILQHELSDR